MTLPVQWRAEARADLADIVGFIAQDSPSAARRMKFQIEQSLRLAAEHHHRIKLKLKGLSPVAYRTQALAS